MWLGEHSRVEWAGKQRRGDRKHKKGQFRRDRESGLGWSGGYIEGLLHFIIIGGFLPEKVIPQKR